MPQETKKIIITILDLPYYICFIVVSKVCLYDFPLWVWAWPWIFFGQWSVNKPDVSRGLTSTCILGALSFLLGFFLELWDYPREAMWKRIKVPSWDSEPGLQAGSLSCVIPAIPQVFKPPQLRSRHHVTETSHSHCALSKDLTCRVVSI